MTRPAFLDVPKPPGIQALPTTGLGMPVPYVTNYRIGDERNTQHVVDTARGKLLVCSCTLGQGRPMLGQQCVTRVRLAMRKRLCGVCGEALDADGEFVFIGIGEAEPHGQDAPSIPASVEAATHPLCSVYSALTCPRLTRDPDNVIVGLTRRYELADSLLVGYDEQREPIYQIYPHGTDRRRIGALNSYIAWLPPEQTRMVTLAQWLRDEAPSL